MLLLLEKHVRVRKGSNPTIGHDGKNHEDQRDIDKIHATHRVFLNAEREGVRCEAGRFREEER